MPVEYRGLCVSWKSHNCHGTSLLASLQFPPLGVSGVVESRAAAIVRPGQTGQGWGVQEVSRDTASQECELARSENLGDFVILWEFYQVCTGDKVVKRSRNVTTSNNLPRI